MQLSCMLSSTYRSYNIILAARPEHEANSATDDYLAADSVKCMKDLRLTSWMAHPPPVPARRFGCMSGTSLLDMKSSTKQSAP